MLLLLLTSCQVSKNNLCPALKHADEELCGCARLWDSSYQHTGHFHCPENSHMPSAPQSIPTPNLRGNHFPGSASSRTSYTRSHAVPNPSWCSVWLLSARCLWGHPGLSRSSIHSSLLLGGFHFGGLAQGVHLPSCWWTVWFLMPGINSIHPQEGNAGEFCLFTSLLLCIECLCPSKIHGEALTPPLPVSLYLD